MDMMVEPGAASHHYGPRSGRRVRMSTPRRPYRTDLSDARWALIEPTLSAWRAGRVGLGISPIQHDLREIRILGATTHPGGQWIVQQARNLCMDLDQAGANVKFVLHDRDAIFP